MPQHKRATRRPATPSADSSTISDPRDAAYRHLSAHAARFPDLIPSEINTGTLDARDAALAHAIVDGALRRWRTLEYVIELVGGHKGHELEPRMRGVLLGGASQLLLLDRVPAHAVLDESVSWAKRYIRHGAGGMVNAILRKVAAVRGEHIENAWAHHIDTIPLSEGGSLVLNGIELPEHGRRRLGIACSLPASLLTRWETMRDDPTAWAMHTLCKPPTVLCTRYAPDIPDFEQLESHDSHDHRIFTGNRQQLISVLDATPGMWVQDPASTATLARIELETTPSRIIDLCAGQGTKTRQLRAMYPQSEIIACEVEPKRLGVLRDLFKDDDSVRVVHAERAKEQFVGWADLVLADVPCSNTGVLARRIEARYRPIDAQLKRLVQTQRSIIQVAADLLGPGGTLLYATCSMEIEENEANAQWATGELGFNLRRAARVEVSAQPGDRAGLYQDASFSAQLTKP